MTFCDFYLYLGWARTRNEFTDLLDWAVMTVSGVLLAFVESK